MTSSVMEGYSDLMERWEPWRGQSTV